MPASGDCICPSYGGKLHRLGDDTDEVLDIEPVVNKVVRHVRPKLSCRACEKNWLFAGSKAGGERAAAIYSIIETCKLNGVEPRAYITDVMQKIASDWPNSRIEELMPWNWSKPSQSSAT